MQTRTSDEIRRLFVDFFVDRDHELVPSAPLIPRDDPTLLFTSAGMVQFKPYYLADTPPMRRAVSVQRCLRLSDLDEVGNTPYHDTFFEMLGNFSFGDYFKQKAIDYAWEFLTDVLGLSRDRLWPTVYRDDDAAVEIWRARIGVPAERIVRLGDEDNFWGPAGDSGPCGPCSEIHYDRGQDVGCGRPECDPACDCDRFFEVWNLVFPQYVQYEDGTRAPLKRPGIDTGMGLERLCTVLQGTNSIFETDLFAPLIESARDEVEAATGSRPAAREEQKAMAIIADHTRAATFAITENILPSNEAQGYVVRRLIRRAARRGRTLGIDGAFLYRIAGTVVDRMGTAHPQLTQKREHVALVVKAEEERFSETLASGTASLEEAMEVLKRKGEKVVPGELAFRLYDTYGFPVDLTEEMAAERGLTVDYDAFRTEMEKQRERGRSAAASAGGDRRWRDATGYAGGGSRFTGYDLALTNVEQFELPRGARLSARAGATVLRTRPGAADGTVEFVLDETPFYAEAGGQVADTGVVAVPDGAEHRVVNVYRESGDAVHVALTGGADVAPGTRVEVAVDVAHRRRVEKNHTATHLLQSALRSALGEHVHQSGSWVGPERLRFDFTHFSDVGASDLEAVEEQVNAWIRADLPVEPEQMPLDRALKRGAMALFGEKYDDDVRVVCVGSGAGTGLSLELCGGTHVARTGEIGSFTVVSESSVAAGVRRIEAVTGPVAADRARSESRLLEEISGLLRSTRDELLAKAEDVLGENARLRKELAGLLTEAASATMSSVADAAAEIEGVRVAAARTEAPDIPSLRKQADELRERLGSGTGILGSVIDGAAVVVVVVTPDICKPGRLKAGDVVRLVAEEMGGRGGGKPHLAQGGGDASMLDAALLAAPGIVERLLKGEG
ncbi:MAG: alanine--tRNA ligase [Candidatus Eisenbacteria bacterium]